MASKGKRRERQAAKIYEQAGYDTFRPQESKFGETDMFGHFDLVAINESGSQWVQVKANATNTNLSEFFTKAAALLPEKHNPEYLICHDRQGWRLAEASEDGYTWTVDERDLSCTMGEEVTRHLERQCSEGQGQHTAENDTA